MNTMCYTWLHSQTNKTIPETFNQQINSIFYSRDIRSITLYTNEYGKLNSLDSFYEDF